MRICEKTLENPFQPLETCFFKRGQTGDIIGEIHRETILLACPHAYSQVLQPILDDFVEKKKIGKISDAGEEKYSPLG